MKIHTHPGSLILRVHGANIVVPVIERDSYEEIVRDMIALMQEHRGVGLAAPQVGLPLRLVVMDPDRTGAPYVMVNPIRNGLGTSWKWDKEGCLSLPGRTFRVRRRKAVSVEWRDLDGKPRVKRFDGWAARVIQHELDHLEGTLLVDHGRRVKK